MAVMTLSDTEITGVLKNVYSGYREKLFPISTPLLANVKKGKSGGPRNLRWGGNGVIFDAVTTRPTGMSASSTGYFPPHAQATEKQGTLPIKRLYVTRQIDGLAITGTQSKEAAYIGLAKKILEEAKDASTLGMQEILHGNGLGIKGVVASTADTTHCVVTSPYGVSGAGQGGLLLTEGEYIAVLDTTGVTVRGRATITSVANSGDNASLVLDTAVTGLAATDLIVAATASDTSYNSYPNGLINLTNRGAGYASVESLSSSTTPRWNTVQYVAATDTPTLEPSEMDVWKLITKVAGISGKDAKLNPGEFLLMTTPGIEQKLAESFLGQRRFTGEAAMNLKGGFKALNICGLPCISDGMCPAGTLYLIHLPSCVWVDAKDWGQVQYESAGAWRFISGRDAFEINWGAYVNFGVLQRNALASITGYTDADRFSFVM